MSLFGSIWDKLTGHAHAQGTDAQPAPTAATQGDRPAPSPDAAPASLPGVDVAAVLDGLARESRQRLDWRHSIVDMLKLLNMESGQPARRALAAELGYDGDTSDSAAMNTWLHAQVMRKLAENGGKVPEDLRR